MFVLQWGNREVSDILKEQFATMHKMGRKVILEHWFWKNQGPLNEHHHQGVKLPTAEEVVERMTPTLSRLNPAHIYGISLAEENTPDAGRDVLLHEIYTLLKQRFPDFRYFQWYTYGLGAMDHYPVPGFGAGLLGADGWIVDDYYCTNANFKRMLQKYHMLDVPVQVIVWASSGWQPSYDTQSAADWAEPQIAMLRSMNMSAGLFSVNEMFSGPTNLTQGGSDNLGSCFAWEMDGLPGSADRHEIKGEQNPPRPEHHYWNGDHQRGEGTPTRVYPGTRAKFDRYA